ncbi:MAG: stage 0 sporulation protein [Thermoleophilia bacterium]|nr:stage 0 sporulation protein [Thermoleophilia bacterium]
MASAVGVVFSPGGKVYSFDPGELELAWDDRVICQTSRGREYGRVVETSHPAEEQGGRLKRIVRRATATDEDRLRENREEARRAMAAFREAIEQHGLPVKPIAVELVFDGSRLVCSYGAEERVDTRRIQEELAARLHRRVELRSVGPREQARLIGGYGLCGTQLCCARFPSHEQPIALRMAKDQELPMSSGRITGLCGRLRCCLAFEHSTYRSFRDRAPRVGSKVQTPHGAGVVRAYAVLRDACLVALDGERELEIGIDDCRELEGPARRRR